MTWDTTLPLGSEAKSNGDNRIREFKNDVETSLRGNAAEGTEAIFPGADTANPVFRYRGLKGTTAARPTAGQYGLYANTTTNTLQRDNGSSWEDIGTLVTNASITEAQLSASVAGDGLAGGAGTPLSVSAGTGLEISADTVRIAAAAAGDGLTGGGGSALAVNVDNSTIEINTDSLRVKDAGITSSKISLSGCRLDFTYAGTSVDPGATSGAYTFNPVVVTAGFDRGMTVASNAFTVPTTGLYAVGGRISFNCDDTHGSTPLTVRLNGSKNITIPSVAINGTLDSYDYFGTVTYLLAGETYHVEVDTDCNGGAHNPNFYKIRGEVYVQYHV